MFDDNTIYEDAECYKCGKHVLVPEGEWDTRCMECYRKAVNHVMH